MSEKEKAARTEQMVRFLETTMDGNKSVRLALRGVRGVSFMFSNAISTVSGLGEKRMADLSEADQQKLEEMIVDPEKFGIPKWMLNRRKDPKMGIDKHLSVSTLDFTNKMDVNEMKKLKIYKGVRHASGLPVRGQRTRSSFRKGKTVGVSRKKAAAGGKK